MFCRAEARLSIGSSCGVEIHVISEQVTERDRVRMVMMRAIARLMRLPWIEGDALIDPCVTVPVARAVGLARAVPIKCIARVEHRNPVHEVPDCSKPCKRFGRGH